MEPIIVLVHDMWHTPEHYRPYIAALEQSLFQVYCPLLSICDRSLPHGPHRSVVHDLGILSSLVKSLIDAGKKVIMVMHGYGGTIGSSVPEKLSFDYRAARGRRGGVIHLLYMCAYILPSDCSMVDLGLWDFPTRAEVVPGMPMQFFLGGGISQTEVARCLPLFVAIPDLVLGTTITQEAWKHIPCTYLFTQNNGVITPTMQTLMTQPVARGGRQYRVKIYDAGHSIYLSHTRAMVEEVQAISGVFWQHPLSQFRMGGTSSSEGSEATS